MSSGPTKHGVVSPEVVAAIDAFFGLRDWEGLWLTGGTCLAEFYFGHRISVDIDLFTADEDLFRTARDVLRRRRSLGTIGEMETVRTDLRFCQFLLRRGGGDPVKVDLVLDIPVEIGCKVRCGEVWLDSLADLTSNKMGCLLQREDVKDFVDLYFLLPHLGLGAKEAIELGQRKDGGLDPIVLAEQMRWIQTQVRPDFLRCDVPWSNVRHFFARLREDVLRLVAPPQA